MYILWVYRGGEDFESQMMCQDTKFLNKQGALTGWIPLQVCGHANQAYKRTQETAINHAGKSFLKHTYKPTWTRPMANDNKHFQG